MKIDFPLDCLKDIPTPFYYYDIDVLDQTLHQLHREAAAHAGFSVHYAVKANANPRILQRIRQAGLGADCVSGGEIEAALQAGFKGDGIVFAGVGKSDWEIELALRNDIFCFNVESREELEVINLLAEQMGKTAQVCFRINPEVGAHTHEKITTGKAENKFGIAMTDLESVIHLAMRLPSIRFIGLHFHIGSQILEMDDFKRLCFRINHLQDRLEAQGIVPKHINVGGGLGIDYEDPQAHVVPSFKVYFDTYAQCLRLREGQQVHFELGRAVVGQCGALISRVLYIKVGVEKRFLILDAGMTDLLRPALYHARHRMENLSAREEARSGEEEYDVVGPICESSDVFAQSVLLPESRRSDLIALLSSGASGEAMASQYNCRRLPASYFSFDFQH